MSVRWAAPAPVLNDLHAQRKPEPRARLTRRAQRILWALLILASLTAGATAQLWDPYTRSLDQTATSTDAR